MEIKVVGNPKEIAALVVAIQERPEKNLEVSIECPKGNAEDLIVKNSDSWNIYDAISGISQGCVC